MKDELRMKFGRRVKKANSALRMFYLPPPFRGLHESFGPEIEIFGQQQPNRAAEKESKRDFVHRTESRAAVSAGRAVEISCRVPD